MKPASFRYSKAILTYLALAILPSTAQALTNKENVPPFGEGVMATGYARINSKSVVHYNETYLDAPSNDTIRASYWSSNRQLIAYKKLVFKTNTDTPESYEYIDYRRSKGYRVSVNSESAAVETVKIRSNGTEDVTKIKRVPLKENTVIDAGFHRFIIANWEALLNGKTMKMNFLQVDRARLVPLKIKQNKCDTPNTACLKLSLDNFLLQGVAPTVRLKYDIPTKTLLAYTGLGPVTKPNGKALPVEILYEYF